MTDFWYWIEGTELAFLVGATWLFPLIESLHVLSAVFVLGTILMVDLRLMGLAALRYASATLLRELLPWCWFAFVSAVVTGGLLFIVQASNYVNNTAFIIKLVLLLLAGVNMLVFHWRVLPGIGHASSVDRSTSRAARVNGSLSLLLWCGIMLAGRWIGHIV